MAQRKHISLKTKLAAALAELGQIPWEDVRRMSESNFLSLWTWDHHPVPVAHGGTDDFWNLVPRLIAAHRRKTAKIDQPMLAKTKRVESKWREFTARMAAKATGEAMPEKRRNRLRSRGFPKGKRNMGVRNG